VRLDHLHARPVVLPRHAGFAEPPTDVHSEGDCVPALRRA
jgi:hypothetical protein